MEFLENVRKDEGAMSEFEIKQENYQEFLKQEQFDTEVKYENDFTIKEEEEDYDEIGNGYEFMETVLVEVEEKDGQETQYSSDQCDSSSKHFKCEIVAMLLQQLLNLNAMLKVYIWV